MATNKRVKLLQQEGPIKEVVKRGSSKGRPGNTMKWSMMASSMWLASLVFLLAVLFRLTHVAADHRVLVNTYAVYSLSVMNRSLVSTRHVLCVSNVELNNLVEENRCASGFGRLVERLLFVSDSHPPGIFPLSGMAVPYGRNLNPIDFSCPKMEVEIDTRNAITHGMHAEGIDISSPGILGISVASPCCGSPHSTFSLDVSAGILTQSLSLRETANQGQWVPSFSSFRLWNQALQPPDVGGISFPAALFFCGRRVSDVINEKNGFSLIRTLTVVISTNQIVTGILLPQEVLRSLSGWISSTLGATSSLHDVGACSFTVSGSLERLSGGATGYLVCYIDPSLRDLLPSLEASPQVSDAIEANGHPNDVAALHVDLNKLVDRNGYLRIGSSGSLSDFVEGDVLDAGYPKVVIGAMLLENTTVILSRRANTNMAAVGLPVILIKETIPEKRLVLFLNNETEGTCAAPRNCTNGEVIFMSLNRCSHSPDCGLLLSYRYNPHTMQCELNLTLLVPLCVLAVFVILSDVAVMLAYWKLDVTIQGATSEAMALKNK